MSADLFYYSQDNGNGYSSSVYAEMNVYEYLFLTVHNGDEIATIAIKPDEKGKDAAKGLAQALLNWTEHMENKK